MPVSSSTDTGSSRKRRQPLARRTGVAGVPQPAVAAGAPSRLDVAGGVVGARAPLLAVLAEGGGRAGWGDRHAEMAPSDSTNNGK